MLFVLFQLGNDRYALEAKRVVEIVPLLEMKRLPQAPAAVAGIFNYRGQPVPAVDLSALTLGRPTTERLSTRIIIIQYACSNGKSHLLGLVAERATEMLRKDVKEFIDPGVRLGQAPYLGPLLMDQQTPVQWIYAQRLLPDTVREVLFSPSGPTIHDSN